jgi:cytochrome c biogenesis protein CcmG/thiol:disulfide interchange protein DsbE
MRALLLSFLLAVGLPASAEIVQPDSFSPADYGDAKVVYLDFWASWCVPCRKSFPWLNAMHTRYGDRGLRIVGINLDREREDADRFLARYPASFDLIFNPSGSLAEHWSLQGMPSAVLVDTRGEVLARHIGFRADRTEEYEQQLKTLLGVQQ